MISLEQQATVAIALIIASVLSAIIGADRERRRREGEIAGAGLRTHMLVGVGSCLFTLLSVFGFPDADSSRVAAQIVSGIGFLGAGVIIQRGDRVKNLTTAASIWLTAAVGMAVGLGAWLLALVATLLVWTILVIIRRLENKPY